MRSTRRVDRLYNVRYVCWGIGPTKLATFFAEGIDDGSVGLPMAAAARAICRRAKFEATVDGIGLNRC